MSLTNFEEITEDLTEAEKSTARNIFYYIQKNYVGKNKTVKSNVIVEADKKQGKQMTDVRIRKMVNWLRVNGFPVCASSSGYFYPANNEELQETIQSLEERIRQIQRSVTGLKLAIKKG